MSEGEIRMQAQMHALLADIEAAKTDVQGMIAENMQRAAVGSSMAFTEEDFADESKDLRDLAQRLRNEI